jgi:hypothetical protein
MSLTKVLLLTTVAITRGGKVVAFFFNLVIFIKAELYSLLPLLEIGNNQHFVEII